MKLTGECKKEYDKWRENKGLENFKVKQYSLDVVNAMIYGVLVDYFDSVLMIVDIETVGEPTMKGMTPLGFRVFINGFKITLTYIPTRPEARTKAIEKANSIRNEQLNK